MVHDDTRTAAAGTPCAARHCPGGGRGLAIAGLLLCAPCARSVEHKLVGLPGAHERAVRALNAAMPTAERVSGGRMPGIPMNFTAVEARARVVEVLASWSQLVVDERGIGAPARSIPAMAAFLARHLRWLAAHPAAGDFADEVGEAHSWVDRVMRPVRAKRVPLGRCPVRECAGEITASLRAPDAGRRPSAVRCSADDEHEWPVTAWGALHRIRQEEGVGV
ncbi:hypothetical protein [Actinokineospora pegani]|uniref:hypothetical protein n=1 Tax=Actinokineospora pegani TaxID=2654637 RepID=UPI0012EA9223|nr:hypothetical protein [Actinokineospora pegani]